MENIVFLDIDGVLLSTRAWAAAENVAQLDATPRERAPALRFDAGSVGLVSRLCRLSGARLVLHSTWRRTWLRSAAELRAKLTDEGFAVELLHERWATPTDDPEADKWADVSSWLEAAEPVTSLLVDDQRFAGAPGRPAPDAQVQPDSDEGFGMAEYRAALAFFEVADRRIRPGSMATIERLASSDQAA